MHKFTLAITLFVSLMLGNLSVAQDIAELPKPIVELLEPGDGPLAELRYQPEPGSVFTISMRTAMSMEMTMAGQRMPQELPDTVMEMTYTIRDVEDGLIHADFRMDDMRAENAAVADMVNQTLAPMRGLTGTLTITDRGVNNAFEPNIPDDAPPELADELRSNAATQYAGTVLPEEPVGVGGKWLVTTVVNQNGMRITQKSEYTVLSIEDGLVRLSMSVDQDAELGKLQLEGVPMEMNLEAFDSAGEGDTVIRTDWIVPVKSSAKIDLGMTMSAAFGEMQQQIGVEVETEGARKD